MSVNGVGSQSPTNYVSNNTDTAPVQAPPTSPSFTEIDPFSVQTGYSVEEQMAFDELSGGMPPPGWPPAKSSPEAQKMMDELGAMIKAAGDNSVGADDRPTMAQAMRMLKELMLKNRTSELSLRDQQILQIYDLKLQAIEKDKEAAQAAFVSAIIKGSFEIGSGAVNFAGGVKQGKMAADSMKAKAADKSYDVTPDSNAAQAVGNKTQGMASGMSGIGNIAAAYFDKKAANARAEADTLRAMADKLSNQLAQTGERYALAREVLLDTIQTEKGIMEATYQAINKRLSV